METDHVATALFGLVHGHVRHAQNVFWVGVLALEQRDAYAGGAVVFYPDFRLALGLMDQVVRFGQCRADFFGNRKCLIERQGVIGIQIAEHHDELVAAKARNGIGFAQAAADAVRRFDQQQISDGMP